MAIDKQDIGKIAYLSRLEIKSEDVQLYVENLSQILQFVDQINSVDTTNISPMSHPLASMVQRTREDEVTEPNNRDYIQRTTNAHVIDGLYVIPAVME